MKLKVLKNGSLANDLFSAFQASAMESFGEKRKSKNWPMLSATLLYAKLSARHWKREKRVLGTFWRVCAR